MTNAGISYKNQISFIQAVRNFDRYTKAQCPQLIRYLRSIKGEQHVVKVFKAVGGTNIPQLINSGEDAVDVIMAYFTEESLREMFATFPVNEMQYQTLQTTPFKNEICEAFRKFRFEIEK